MIATDVLTDKALLSLTPERMRAMIAGEPELAAWVMVRLQALALERAATGAAGKPDLSTPSAMIPPYAKANKKERKGKRRGRPTGHAGARRAAPLRIDHRAEHKLRCCPDCGHRVGRPRAARRRVIEDIEQTKAAATEHTIHQYYCTHCHKRVEPKVTQALPKSAIGNRTLALTAWLHYGLGTTVSQIEQVLARVFQLPLSGGGLAQQWQRLGEILRPWHEQIGQQARGAAVLHADETGWRVNGRLNWLWCFTAPALTYYTIDRSRGAGVLLEFLGQCFAGTLVSDFFGAYNKIAADRRQVCLVHLLREIKRVSERNRSENWLQFARTLRRILKDAIGLAARGDRAAADYGSKRERIKRRLEDLCYSDIRDGDAVRLMKRLFKHEDYLFTCLDDLAVPPDNNRAEREIRPAVIARKNSFHNTSDRGAQTQATLMSIYRTLKLRDLDPMGEIVRALETFIRTGALPPLPAAAPDSTPPPPPPDG